MNGLALGSAALLGGVAVGVAAQFAVPPREVPTSLRMTHDEQQSFRSGDRTQMAILDGVFGSAGALFLGMGSAIANEGAGLTRTARSRNLGLASAFAAGIAAASVAGVGLRAALGTA